MKYKTFEKNNESLFSNIIQTKKITKRLINKKEIVKG